MAASIQTTRTVASELSIAPAHADSRQSLALDGTLGSPSSPSIISGQGLPPSQQYQQEANEAGESTSTSDNVTHSTGNSPGGTRLRSLFNTTTHSRSTSSVNSQQSSHSMRSVEIAHWTNSFVHYTPIPPPRQKPPPIIYQPIGPEPPLIPPLTLGPSISDCLLPEDSPVFQPLPDIPELPGLEFSWMVNVADRLEGVDTQLGSFEGAYSSPSTIHEHADVLDDDFRSSTSTSSDTDDPQTDNPPESIMSPMDLPATGWLPSERILEMGDGPMLTNEQSPEDPSAMLASSTVKPHNIPQRHKKPATLRDWINKTKPGELFVGAWADLPVVPGTPRPPWAGTQHSDIVPDPCDHQSFITTSEYGGGFVCCRCRNSS
ncbi:hypothetical protein BKA82DRAFT_4098646 [Pisolithus tinctorius]|nr:hypothetical protein BKA82DRAFT_4098646 [Pisolithus tinctorius]